MAKMAKYVKRRKYNIRLIAEYVIFLAFAFVLMFSFFYVATQEEVSKRHFASECADGLYDLNCKYEQTIERNEWINDC